MAKKGISPPKEQVLQTSVRLTDYLSLSPLETFIADVLAIYVTPLKQQQFENFLSQKNVPGLGKYDPNVLHVAFHSLIRKNICEKTGKFFRVTKRIREPIVRYLFQQQKYHDRYLHAHKVGETDRHVYKGEYYTWHIDTWEDGVREARQAILTGKTKNYNDCLRRIERKKQSAQRELLDELIGSPFDSIWFESLVVPFQNMYLTELVHDAFDNLSPIKATQKTYIHDLLVQRKKILKTDELLHSYLQYILLREEHEAMDSLLKNWQIPRSILYLAEATQAFFANDFVRAKEKFTSARRQLKTESKAKSPTFPKFFELVHLVYSLQRDDTAAFVWSRAAQDRYDKFYYGNVWEMLRKVQEFQTEGNCDTNVSYPYLRVVDSEICLSFVKLLDAATAFWCQHKDKDKAQTAMLEIAEKAEPSGFAFLAKEATAIAKTLKKDVLVSGESGVLSGLVKIRSRWEIARDVILNLHNKPGTTEEEITNNQRMSWRLNVRDTGFRLEAYEQIRTKTGEWSRGKKVSERRLHDEWPRMPSLSEQDKKICQKIKVETHRDRYYPETFYFFNDDSLLELIGHPAIFKESDPEVRLELIASRPALEIITNGQGDKIVMKPFPKKYDWNIRGQTSGEIQLTEETPTRYKVVRFDETHFKVARVISEKGLPIPTEKKQEIGSFFDPLIADFNIIAGEATPLLLESSATIELQDANSQMFLHLVPNGDQLQVEMLVYPLGETEPEHHPGYGTEAIVAEINGKRVMVKRDFALEQKNMKVILDVCTALAKSHQEGNRYTLTNATDSLEFLSQLQSLNESQVIVKWPRGEKIQVSSAASFRNMNLSLSGTTDWLEASGSLKIGNINVDLAELLKALEESPTRFVRLNDKEYLALTEEFRKKLDELKHYSTRQGKKIQIHPLAAHAVNASLEGVAKEMNEFKVAPAWKEIKKRFLKAEKYSPDLPRTFQGELREYQWDGFSWLAKLSAWGAGACLADDMGLGKTIQALALLLLRAKTGPALVVAPTSVCANWEREAEKFAPNLNVIRISAHTAATNGNRQDRAKLIKKAGPRDILVTNYSIMQIESELLAAKKFATIILDEAQAIKNHDAARTQAAMKLQGDFRVIMTGTPVENHLGELWSLFQFINPGFLGSRKSFDDRFAIPVTLESGNETKQHLRQMVRPFILRRTKSAVLEELPPKTEIQLEVELSKEEAALYETIRTTAIKNLEKAKDENLGAKHLRILAELMRLRRACCHPALVLPKAKIACSKLELFAETVTDLLENNHKALVFSQFVDYLKLIRGKLDEMKVSYQYLDGSMTQKKRQKAIDAFQAGESDIFLISLKAGGSGLNLTAADYVIHMDPWWNPAVENQASDRAHRIGQQRPVTVYRMITKGTIEEKIIELHHHKETLAREILDGTDTPSKLSLEQLMLILKE